MFQTRLLATVGLIVPLARVTLAQAPCSVPSEFPAPLTWTDDFLVADFVPGPTADSFFVGGTCFCGGGSPQPLVFLHTATGWQSLPFPVLSGTLRVLARIDLGSGPELYAAGSWTAPLGNPPVSSLLRWNGATFVDAPPPPGTIDDFEAFDDGFGAAVYSAGQFGVHRWSGTTWIAVGLTSGASTAVLDLVVHDDGTGPALYAAGGFDAVDGVATGKVARWNGSVWSGVGAFAFGVNGLHASREESGPALYAFGGFTGGGAPAGGLARWNGSTWSSAGAGLPVDFGAIRSVTTFDDGTGRGPELIVSGPYSPLPTAQVHPVMRRSGATWTDLPAFATAGWHWNGGPTIVRADTGDWIGCAFEPGVPTGVATVASIARCDLTGRLYCAGDGVALACPCANESAIGERRGCVNSSGAAGTLRARGAASLSSDTLQLDGTGMPDGPVLYYQGAREIAPFVFGDGLACTGGPFVRLRTVINVAGASSDPSGSAPSLSTQGLVLAPGTRCYQARYRDGAAFCTSATFNYTNGVAIVWSP